MNAKDPKTRLTKKQEAFCQAVMSEDDYSKAYRKAYPSSRKWKDESVHRKAHEMAKKNGKVMARIESLQKEATERHMVTVDSIRAEIDRDKAFAVECKSPASLLRATELKAKLYGFLQGRVKQDVSMSIEEVRREMEAEAEADAIIDTL